MLPGVPPYLEVVGAADNLLCNLRWVRVCDALDRYRVDPTLQMSRHEVRLELAGGGFLIGSGQCRKCTYTTEDGIPIATGRNSVSVTSVHSTRWLLAGFAESNREPTAFGTCCGSQQPKRMLMVWSCVSLGGIPSGKCHTAFDQNHDPSHSCGSLRVTMTGSS
jgi:hypothetical protein